MKRRAMLKRSVMLRKENNDADIEKEFLSIKEVAPFLKVHVQSLHRMIRDGRFQASKVGGQWRIKRSWLMKKIGGEPNV